MADRRRRKCPDNENSDCESEESGEERRVNNSSNQGSEVGNSEYESVDEEELADVEAETLEGGGVLLLPGDGEDPKSLDHDEDRKNPQYIPKKGTFYEHDDRTMGEGEETTADNVSEKSAPQEKELKKKVWKEDGKWQHDRFSIYDQSPKSREELVATYGYDIRNEEGPPRARRRRRYGRGPNKYTRNWEDMDAYSKPTRGKGEVRGGGLGRGRKKSSPSSLSGEEYPSLPSKHTPNEEEEDVVETQKSTIPSTPVELPKVLSTPTKSESTYDNTSSSGNKNASYGDQGNRMYVEDQKGDLRGMGGRGSRPGRKMRPGSRGAQRNYGYSEEIHSPSRGRGDGRGKPTNRGRHMQGQGSYVQQNYQPKDVHDLTEELKSVTITPSVQKEELHYKKNKIIDNRRSTIPPRLQETMRGNKPVPHGGGIDPNSVSKPKRYSSQRQKPLQDQIGQYHHPQGYYDQTSAEPDYNKMYEQVASPPGAATPQLTLPTHAAPPPAFVAPFPPNTRLFPSGTPQPHLIGPPVTGPPIGPPPVAGPGVVSGPPVPGTVGGAPVAGPPFLPPENMINYATPPPALVTAPHPPQFPAFQAFTPVSQQQPQEIYSNGVTYYNTQSQQHLPRINPVLQKRPKAAIPIVPPPDKQRYTREVAGNDYRNRSDSLEAGNDYRNRSDSLEAGNDYRNRSDSLEAGNDYGNRSDSLEAGNDYGNRSDNIEAGNDYGNRSDSLEAGNDYTNRSDSLEAGNDYRNTSDSLEAGNDYTNRSDSIEAGNDYRNKSESPDTFKEDFNHESTNINMTSLNEQYFVSQTDTCVAECPAGEDSNEDNMDILQEFERCSVQVTANVEDDSGCTESLTDELPPVDTVNCEKTEVESSLTDEPTIKVNGENDSTVLDVQSTDIQASDPSEEAESLPNCDNISTESKPSKENEVAEIPLAAT